MGERKSAAELRAERELKRRSGPGRFRVEGCRGAFVRGKRYRRGDLCTLKKGELAGHGWVRIEGEAKVPTEVPPEPHASKQALSELQTESVRHKPPGA